MASLISLSDLDSGISYNSAPPAIQKLLDKVKARKKKAGETDTNRMGGVPGDMPGSSTDLSSRLDELIQFGVKSIGTSPLGIAITKTKNARAWKKHIVPPGGNKSFRSVKSHDDHIEDIAHGLSKFRFISSELDSIIKFDSNGPPRNNLGYKIKPLTDNVYASDEGGLYTPTHEIKPGSDILNYPHLQHGKFTNIVDRKGRPTYESRKQAKIMGSIGGGLLGTVGGAAGGYGLHAALEGGRLGRHSKKLGAAYAVAGPIVGAAIGYHRGSKKMLPQDKIQNRLSAKLDKLIQFGTDPRPRNPLGEFSGQEEGPDANAMVKTYRIAPAQPGMAPNKSGGPGLLGAGALTVLGGAGGALGGKAGGAAWDKIGKAIKQYRK